jgi:hypothetical protein
MGSSGPECLDEAARQSAQSRRRNVSGGPDDRPAPGAPRATTVNSSEGRPDGGATTGRPWAIRAEERAAAPRPSLEGDPVAKDLDLTHTILHVLARDGLYRVES